MSSAERSGVRLETESGEGGRRRWVLGAKAIVTVGILAFLLWRVDLGRFWASILSAHGGLFALALISNVLLLVISTLKWEKLLNAVSLPTSKWALFRLYTIGFFASSFLPGIVGGDFVRWHLASKDLGGQARVAGSILAERATGVIALLALAVPSAILILPRVDIAPFFLLLLILATGLTAFLALVLSRRLITSLRYRGRRLPFGSLLRSAHKLQRSLRSYPPRTLIVALVYSVAFYVSAGLAFFLVCKAFGAPVGFVEATAVHVLIGIVVLIPISLGGLGLAQAGDVYLLGLLGVSPHHALAISMARFVIRYVYAAIGGVMFLRWQSGSASGDSRLPGKDREVSAVARVEGVVAETAAGRQSG